MSNKILTVSVAAYNVEKYIQQNIESMIIPEIMDLLEVFIVDDGGTDQTAEIAKKYEEQYPETFHVVHKENGGYGTTVNYSMAHATGKYFKLLDGDDWFDANHLKYLIKALRTSDADVVFTHYAYGCDEKNLRLIKRHHMHNGYECLMKDFVPRKPVGMWCITFKTELLRRTNLILPSHSLYTDQLYAIVPFSAAKKALFIDLPVYCYRVGRDGQSMSVESRIRHKDEMLRICRKTYEFCETQRNSENYRYILRRVARFHVIAIQTYLLLPLSDHNRRTIKRYDQKIRREFPDIYKGAARCQKMGIFVSMMRKTNYMAYWLLKIYPALSGKNNK
ncbi:glycosyltransferase [Lachnospiraceae bacterium WCA-9-b2]|jgi:Glycosyltransferases involved in cell wall biogenesis|uniref:Glycosyltransferase n=1 Tax=Sporofaciens musculi TaxID=2681861 RepID=A0A7X3MI37_9FIRM|nr:glycosyltransferase family 2 protein [Sporofaciens musculi]MXP76804.1 glycosyltransferase [Sporofaciens musculi]